MAQAVPMQKTTRWQARRHLVTIFQLVTSIQRHMPDADAYSRQ